LLEKYFSIPDPLVFLLGAGVRERCESAPCRGRLPAGWGGRRRAGWVPAPLPRCDKSSHSPEWNAVITYSVYKTPLKKKCQSINQESGDIACWNGWLGEDAGSGVLRVSEKVMGGPCLMEGLQAARCHQWEMPRFGA